MIRRLTLPCILFIFSLLLSYSAEAQWNPPASTVCADSNFRTVNCACAGTDFRPVCGCDGATYVNSCTAEHCGAVRTYTDGPCEPIAYKVYGNPFTEYFGLTIYLKERGSFRIAIVDTYGRMYFQQNYPTIDANTPWQNQFSGTMLPRPGMYFMLLFTDKGGYAIAPLLKAMTP